MAKRTLDYYTDLGDIDAETLAQARSIVGVDYTTGEPIEPKLAPVPTSPPPERVKPETVTPTPVKMETKTEPMKAPEPTLEDKLRVLIPYLDVKYDNVTFGRVRNDMRHIDGRNVRELLVSAGIIDTKLHLTEKGKAWLAQS